MAQSLSSEGLKSVADTTKQIITLATGVLALTVTFLEKIVQPTATSAKHIPWPLFGAWVAFGLSIVASVAVLMAVSGSLDAMDRRMNGQELKDYQAKAVDELSNGANVRIPGLLMMIFFVLAMFLTVWTGIAVAFELMK